MKTDSLFFSVFKRLPAVVLELAGLEVSGEGYSFHAEELKQTAFRLDGVLKPPEGDRERPYVFAEVQFNRTTTFIRDFSARYCCIYDNIR